jgi:hypothetical protein
LKALEQGEGARGLVAIERLAEVGRMEDVGPPPRPPRRRRPARARSRASATWQIWSRSGDPAIDKLFARGLAQMEAGALDDALGHLQPRRQAQARLRRRLEQAGDDPVPARPLRRNR